MQLLGKLLPLVTQLGNYLKMAIDYYVELKTAGKEAGPEIVAVYLRDRLSSWDPQVNGTSLLDDPTRDAAARFLAGVAVNFVGLD